MAKKDKEPTPKPGNPRSYSYIGEMPKKYSPQYKSPAELSDLKKDAAAARRNVSNAAAGDKSRGYVKDGKYRPTEVQTADFRKFRRAEAMPVEAKRDAIAAMRNKAKRK